MDGDAERIEAEDKHNTEGYCPSGSLADPARHAEGKERERGQNQPRLGNVTRDRLGNTNIDRVKTLRGWLLK